MLHAIARVNGSTRKVIFHNIRTSVMHALGARLRLSSGDWEVCLKLLYAKEEIKVLLPSASKV